jgi:O-antigen/teichoic acid export membrane protein
LPFVSYTFFRMLQDFGFTDVMIKHNDTDQSLYSSIYWTIVIGGLVVSFINYICSPLLGLWTQHPDSVEVNKWFSLVILIGSFSIGLEGMMRKELNFKFPFFIEFFANLIAGIAAIYLAYIGWSWKAIVMRFLVHIILQLAFNIVYTNWKPSLVFNSRSLRPHLQFAMLSISEQTLNFFHRNIDTVLISRYIGSHALGIYDRSYKLLLFPLQQVSGAFSKVMFPAFSKIQDDLPKVGQHFLHIVALISVITFPMMLGLYILCEDFVFVVFGSQWMEMVPIIKLFAIISIFQSISTITGSIFSATDNMKRLIKYSLYSKPISILAIFIAVWLHKDIYYVALYITVSSFIMMFPLWHILAKSIGIRSIDIWLAILPQLCISVLMVLGLKGFTYYAHSAAYSHVLTLTIGIALGIVIYTGLIYISGNKAAKSAWQLTKNLLSKGQNSQMTS